LATLAFIRALLSGSCIDAVSVAGVVSLLASIIAGG
jgi:hypothetical protein